MLPLACQLAVGSDAMGWFRAGRAELLHLPDCRRELEVFRQLLDLLADNGCELIGITGNPCIDEELGRCGFNR